MNSSFYLNLLTFWRSLFGEANPGILSHQGWTKNPAYPEPSQTSKNELSAKVVNGLVPLTTFAKSPLSDTRLDSEWVLKTFLVHPARLKIYLHPLKTDSWRPLPTPPDLFYYSFGSTDGTEIFQYFCNLLTAVFVKGKMKMVTHTWLYLR